MAVKEIKEKSIYVCTECGYESAKWQGRCPDCGNWNTLVEETRIIGKEKKGAPAMQREASPVMALDTVNADESVRYHTGMEELDRVLGGGIVPGAAILVCGDPGIGKSTVLLQMCRTLEDDLQVLYVSGEESPRQIKLRANRLGVTGEKVLLTAATVAATDKRDDTGEQARYCGGGFHSNPFSRQRQLLAGQRFAGERIGYAADRRL